MKHVPANKLKSGMVLAEGIYSFEQKKMIAPKGTVLTDALIMSLKNQTVIEIMVEDESIDKAEAEENVPEEMLSHAEKLRRTHAFKTFKNDFENTFSGFSHKINSVIAAGEPLNPQELTTPVFTLVRNSSNPSGLFDMLHSLRLYSDETYAHSVNVSLISNAIGQWMGLPEAELAILTQAGLLHDIGKLLIPDIIIKKPGKLSEGEYKIMKEHPQRGYDLVKDQNINEHIKNAILMHHERCDGSGYPSGLKYDEIDPIARIVAIADVYDAITSARVYRDALCPFVALQILEDEGLQKYDTKAILSFLSNVVNTYLFNRVRLSDSSVADIVYINREHFARPTVRIGDKYIDLSVRKDLSIEEIL